MIIEEILQEIKENCSENIFNHLNAFIQVKLQGYRLIKEETSLALYETDESVQIYRRFFISKKLQGLSERSLNYYKNELNNAFARISKPVLDITSDDLKYYLACIQLEGNCTNTTIDNKRRVLNTFFEWMENEEYIPRNPMKKIKKIKQKKQIKKALSFEEVEKIKIVTEKIKDEYKRRRNVALVDFLLSTGVRAAEVTNIKISDVNFEAGEVFVTGKGNKERFVYLNMTSSLRLREYLSNRKGESEYLFCSLQSPYKKLEVSAIEGITRELGEYSGIEKVHPHRFRRTFATIAHKRGMKIEEISRVLGHENISTTQIYVQVEDEDIKKSHEKYMN